MSDTRHPLAHSLSFSGSPSAETSRPLKRRLTTTDVDFFSTAATSFKPRPYTPSGNVGLQSKSSQSSRNNYRAMESLAIPTPIMDPTPNDPNALFIHPPFTSFPDSHLTPDGLSYAIMAANQNWFLDSNDFKSANSTNPDAIPYPPHLEPPRGWCPAKKRDLKNRGTDGWPEGEEPRLRCTFCRRTYAGVNAKSMWRRHVFEKHKIAMSNRRDSNERPRGRGSNKENKHIITQKMSEGPLSNGFDLQPTTQYTCESNGLPAVLLKSKFCSTLPVNDSLVETGYPVLAHDPRPPESQTFLDPRLSSPHFLVEPTLSPMSPPLTPHLIHTSDTSDSQNSAEGLISATSPIVSLQLGPSPPYDPLLSPSFRHSPPRLPSDQPWRFPSPSHPLHSRVQDLCLTMLAPIVATPVTKNIPLVDASPAGIPSSGHREPDSESAKLSEPSSQTSLFKSRLVGRFNHEQDAFQIMSPLSRNSVAGATDRKNRLTSPSKPTDEWISDNGLFSADLGAKQDPFEDLYSHWLDLKSYTSSHAAPALGVESPVLRSGTLPSTSISDFGTVGMGTAPFTFHSRDINESNVEYFSPLAGDESDGVLATPWTSYLCLDGSELTAGDAEVVELPKKRRRTID